MGAPLEAVRTYGDFHGLKPEDFERLRPDLPFSKVVYQDGVLSVDYEGHYIDVEGFLDAITPLLPPPGWGMLDFIDQIDWKLTRYVIRDGAWQAHDGRAEQAVDAVRDKAGA